MDYWARQLLHAANSRQRTTGSRGFHAQAHTAAGRLVQCEHAHRTMTAAQTCSRSGAFKSYVRSIETADAAEAARRAAAHAARQQRRAAVTAARQTRREAKTPAEKQHAASQIRRAGGLTPRGFLGGLLRVLIFAGVITGIVFIVIAAVKSDKPGPALAVPLAGLPSSSAPAAAPLSSSLAPSSPPQSSSLSPSPSSAAPPPPAPTQAAPSTAAPPPPAPTQAAPAPTSASGAWCTATASVYYAKYNWNNVYVHSNQPYTDATASADGDSWSYETDGSGYALIYLNGPPPGAEITVTVGGTTCTTSD
jgi:hypothetical protein